TGTGSPRTGVVSARLGEQGQHAGVELYGGFALVRGELEGGVHAGQRDVAEARAQHAHIDAVAAVQGGAAAGAGQIQAETGRRAGQLLRELAQHRLEV